jgi:hypothetical protein
VTETADAARTAFETALESIAPRVQRARARRTGDIAFRLAGASGKAGKVLAVGSDGVEVVDAAGRTGTPLVEVLGDPEAVRAVLSGEVEGRKRFLAGGLRVRGDLRYLSDLATELGLLAKPL